MATAEVKRFTGYMAIDNTPHDSMKKAVEHSRTVKIKEALTAKFVGASPAMHKEIEQDDTDSFVLSASNIPEFLFNNREAIMACYDQKVTLRAPRKPRNLKAEVTVTGGSVT